MDWLNTKSIKTWYQMNIDGSTVHSTDWNIIMLWGIEYTYMLVFAWGYKIVKICQVTSNVSIILFWKTAIKSNGSVNLQIRLSEKSPCYVTCVNVFIVGAGFSICLSMESRIRKIIEISKSKHSEIIWQLLLLRKFLSIKKSAGIFKLPYLMQKKNP